MGNFWPLLADTTRTSYEFWQYDPEGQGWHVYGQGTVTPDAKQVVPDDDRGRNVDHLVWSERGAYAIETKSGGLRRSHLTQAKVSAWWAKEKFGARWVEPLICVGNDPTSEPRYENGVWVLSPEQLRPWLQARPVTSRGIPLTP